MMSLSELGAEFSRVRENSVLLCRPLEIEDFELQAAAFTSPPKWHLAHTTWFFETFILKPHAPDYRPWHPAFEALFNSYYNAVGTPFNRAQRGLLSRPTVREIYNYRRAIDEQVLQLLNDDHLAPAADLRSLLEIGLHHEQQHQELILTDLKFCLNINPLKPAYSEAPPGSRLAHSRPENHWRAFEGGVVTVGADGSRFCFDNETPVHRQFLEPFALASGPVSNGDILEFIEDGGYQRPDLWLADGWDQVCRDNWTAPLYWRRLDGDWVSFTLGGELPLVADEPACHLSFYEADAFARWAGARLPTEAEWEVAAGDRSVTGNFAGTRRYHPCADDTAGTDLAKLFGDVWEWTGSGYLPYPGFKPGRGAIGEYNGKFMSNQMVLRGGSCVSDSHHIRASYRNFFYPDDRWQFSGLRLARTL